MASVDQRFAEQDVRLEKRFAGVDARLAELRTDMLKLMFIYWSGTMLAMAGFVFAMLLQRR